METTSFESILNSHQFADFKLVVNNTPYLLHRAILNQRSSYFNKLFKQDPTLIHYEIEIDQEIVGHLQSLFLWMYSSPNFRVNNSNFCCITKLALKFGVDTLIDQLLLWATSNLDISTVLTFCRKLLHNRKELPSFFSLFTNYMIRFFDQLDFEEMAHILPFSSFYRILINPTLIVSSYNKSLAIAIYLITRNNLSNEKKAQLVKIYLDSNWIMRFSDIYNNSNPDLHDSLIQFAVRNLSSITLNDLSHLPHDALIKILSSENLDARDEEEIKQKCEQLTKINNNTTDQINIEILLCIRDANHPRTFMKRVITLKTLRCLVIGSMGSPFLDDIQTTLVDSQINPDHIVLINGDISTPSLDLLFPFDIIFLFTHYQFESSAKISQYLTKYAIERGGGIVIAYGFMRNDEWGCGESDLLKLMPFTRGPRSSDSETVKYTIRVNESCCDKPDIKPFCDKIKQISSIVINQFSPRAHVNVANKAKLIAEYNDGIPFIAYKEIPNSNSKFVGLNYYPITDRVHPYGYNPNYPIAHLLSEAIKFAVGITD